MTYFHSIQEVVAVGGGGEGEKEGEGEGEGGGGGEVGKEILLAALDYRNSR